jgi:hypothetical protein
MSIKGCIDRLEDAWADCACPTCGKSSDEVVVHTSWDNQLDSEDEPERCPSCWELPIRVQLEWD